jgi:hypothetical protein
MSRCFVSEWDGMHESSMVRSLRYFPEIIRGFEMKPNLNIMARQEHFVYVGPARLVDAREAVPADVISPDRNAYLR